jgi:hypothetical protein
MTDKEEKKPDKGEGMPTVSGWDNGLSQDYSRGLGRWFADRPGARQQLLNDVLKENE